MEIAGAEGATKAETLAGKLREVLGDQAVIARPTIKGELRLIGLDDSTTEEEVRNVLEEAGECQAGNIRTGPIRRMKNGLGTIWAQCLLTASLRITAPGKIKIGWTVARVKALKSRPLQCFKCCAYGHVKSCCQEEKDRTNTCYKCGTKGHSARSCTKSPSCAICTEKGLSGQHRMGLQACSLANPRTRQAQSDRRTRPTTNNGHQDNSM